MHLQKRKPVQKSKEQLAKEAEDKKQKEAEAKGDPRALLRTLALANDQWVRLVLLIFFAACTGVSFPAFSTILGRVFNVFYEGRSEIDSRIWKYSLMFVGVGVASGIFWFAQVFCAVTYGSLVVRRLRLEYFKALLRQEVAFFDKSKTGPLLTHLNSDAQLIQTGISQKLGMFVNSLSQVAFALGVAFYYGWRMTLVTLALSPLAVVFGAINAWFLSRSTATSQQVEGRAVQIATESIGNIRTVLSFTARERECARFDSVIAIIEALGKRKAHSAGSSFGSGQMGVYFIYAIGFWYGGGLVADGSMKPGDLLTVFFTIIFAGMGIGQALSIVPDLGRAQGAATQIFIVVDRQSLVPPNTGTGHTAAALRGDLKLQAVNFAYPQRPDAPILSNLSLDLRAGQVTAIVGPSGSGKSTMIALLERFYDPQMGSVTVDGVDLKTYDLLWFRSQCALVSQEPVLFSCSIEDNIRYAKIDASDEEIRQAAKLANAHDFIEQLPKGYRTTVGDRGTQLSGGQKQRVGIARALLRDPRVLLLDEATSALDNESERLVQEALQRLMVGRTCIVIAHRLTTIRSAERIVVLDHGQVLEQGTHDELVRLRGHYEKLVHRQLLAAADELHDQPRSQQQQQQKQQHHAGQQEPIS